MGNARSYNITVKKRIDNIPNTAEQIFKETRCFTQYGNRQTDEAIISELHKILAGINLNELNVLYQDTVSGSVTEAAYTNIYIFLQEEGYIDLVLGDDDYSRSNNVTLNYDCEELITWDEKYAN